MAVIVTKFIVAGGNNNAADWNSVLQAMAGNFIASGLTPTDGGGINLTIADGIAFCGGVRHTITGGPHTVALTDNTTNYVFYDPTTLDFHQDTDNTKPTNAVTIAVIVTLAADITLLTDTRKTITIPTITSFADATHTHAAAGASGGRVVINIFSNITPAITGWTTPPSPSNEMTDDDKVEFATPGVCDAGVAGTIIWDAGAIYFVPLLRIDLKFTVSSGVSASKSFIISISSNGADWTTLQSWATANSAASNDGQVFYYDNTMRYLKLGYSAGAGATNTGTLSGRRINSS